MNERRFVALFTITICVPRHRRATHASTLQSSRVYHRPRCQPLKMIALSEESKVRGRPADADSESDVPLTKTNMFSTLSRVGAHRQAHRRVSCRSSLVSATKVSPVMSVSHANHSQWLPAPNSLPRYECLATVTRKISRRQHRHQC